MSENSKVKVLHIGKKGNMEKYSEPDSFLKEVETVDLPARLDAADYLKEAADADFIVADAIAPVSAELINGMPKLKMIHSEGVAFNSIDIKDADEKGVLVCNSRGMNASAVAEQAVLLMSAVLKDAVEGDAAVRNGQQIQTKEGYMQRGDLKELADCSVGLVGYGDIASATAKLLSAYGVKDIHYYKRNRLSAEEEKKKGITYLPLDELLALSDIVSLHLPVTPETTGIAGEDFFGKMKDGSYLINTARGELVDDNAMVRALSTGKLKMAGLDTLDNEPVQKDHPLINLPEDIAKKIIFSPHIGGITASSFKRSYAYVWEDIETVLRGERPARTVNGK